MPEMLPCTLRLPHKSKNPSYKDDDKDEKEDDPDYQRLSDFTSMMEALKKKWCNFVFVNDGRTYVCSRGIIKSKHSPHVMGLSLTTWYCDKMV